jgi:hypothetical protein
VEGSEAAFLDFGGRKEEERALEEGLEEKSPEMQEALLLGRGLVGSGHSLGAPDSRNLIGGGKAASWGGKARLKKGDTPEKRSKGLKGGPVGREVDTATWKEVERQAGDNWWADSGRESRGAVCVESEEEEMDVNWGMGWGLEESGKERGAGAGKSESTAPLGRVGLHFEQEENLRGGTQATPLGVCQTAGKLGIADTCTSDGNEKNNVGRNAERGVSAEREAAGRRREPRSANTHMRWGDDSEGSEVEEALNTVDMVIETLGSSGGDSPKVDAAAGMEFCKGGVPLGAVSSPQSGKRAARENRGEGDREMRSPLPQDPFGWVDDLKGEQLVNEEKYLGKFEKREKRKEMTSAGGPQQLLKHPSTMVKRKRNERRLDLMETELGGRLQLQKRPPGRERSGRGSELLETRLLKYPPERWKARSAEEDRVCSSPRGGGGSCERNSPDGRNSYTQAPCTTPAAG